MDNNENKESQIFYNIRNDNEGNVYVEKTVYDGNDEVKANDSREGIIDKKEEVKPEPEKPTTVPQYRPSYDYSPKEKKSISSSHLAVLFIVLVMLVATGFYVFNIITGAGKKNRTFMIYMVGSDLESTGGYATFDLYDIENASIDLENNNVLLMVGGSKKWHNFVDSREIGLYKLGKNGFEKIKEYPLSTMGSSDQLSEFLRYSVNRYPAHNYDLVFWNHGLGALGLEDDELSGDYIDIQELDAALKDSPFNNRKLELVIFNNCLSGNLQFASIMSNYADYMVGSEEIMYVGSIIDRLNFLGDIKKDDNGFEIARYYIETSDNSMKALNESSYQQYDTTLSIIDLSVIDKVNDNLDKFMESVDLDNYYYNISRARMKLHTYSGEADYMYDTVDLYEMVEALEPFSTNRNSATELKNSISKAVRYNSANNEHSNGLSIYFPYYGSTNVVEAHLYYFDKLWNNNYVDFISGYYATSTRNKRANRALSGSEINKLSNPITIEGNTVKIELSEKEKENYQRANIYVFEKNEDSYSLIVKSNKVKLDGNIMSYNFNGVLKSTNGNYISLNDLDKSYIYSKVSDNDAVTYINIDDDVSIVGSIYDSGDKPTMGIVDKTIDPDDFYQVKYKLFENEELIEDWYSNGERTDIKHNEESDKLVFTPDSLNKYYVMVELYDLNNDTFYAY